MAALLIAVAAAAIVAWREWTWRRAVASLREDRDRTRAELDGVSRLARDLRSPLQGVLGNTELIMAVSDSTAAEELRDIHDSAARAADIVRTIAAVADATSLSRRWHDLNDIVARALDGCRPALTAAGTRVDFERSERLPLVYVDGGQLERALTALLRPTPRETSLHAGGTATLVTRRGEGAEDRLFVEFDDRTLPAEDDPLGDLAESRRIVAAHGGRLVVDRPLRGGYRFVLELPVWTM